MRNHRRLPSPRRLSQSAAPAASAILQEVVDRLLATLASAAPRDAASIAGRLAAAIEKLEAARIRESDMSAEEWRESQRNYDLEVERLIEERAQELAEHRVKEWLAWERTEADRLAAKREAWEARTSGRTDA
jgi:hypothetical protein